MFAANLLPFYAHRVGGVVAILIGPLQFSSRIRDRNLGLHRWLGRVYLAAVGVGGIGGLAMAPVAYGGLSARVGFAMLAVLWLLSGAIAYVRIRQGDVAAHRRWMTRCYALTFATATLRQWIGVLMVSHPRRLRCGISVGRLAGLGA